MVLRTEDATVCCLCMTAVGVLPEPTADTVSTMKCGWTAAKARTVLRRANICRYQLSCHRITRYWAGSSSLKGPGDMCCDSSPVLYQHQHIAQHRPLTTALQPMQTGRLLLQPRYQLLRLHHQLQRMLHCRLQLFLLKLVAQPMLLLHLLLPAVGV